MNVFKKSILNFLTTYMGWFIYMCVLAHFRMTCHQELKVNSQNYYQNKILVQEVQLRLLENSRIASNPEVCFCSYILKNICYFLSKWWCSSELGPSGEPGQHRDDSVLGWQDAVIIQFKGFICGKKWLRQCRCSVRKLRVMYSEFTTQCQESKPEDKGELEQLTPV